MAMVGKYIGTICARGGGDVGVLAEGTNDGSEGDIPSRKEQDRSPKSR